MTFHENTSTLPTLNNTLATDDSLPVYQNTVLATVHYLGIYPLIATLGIFGNILTLIVLFKVKYESTTSTYLKNLAVADLLTLCVKVACCVLRGFQIHRLEIYLTWKTNSASMSTLAYFSEKVSRYITVAIIVERIMAVMCPFRVKEICSPKRTVIGIVTIYISALLVSLPIIIDIHRYAYTSEGGTLDKYPTTITELIEYSSSRTSKVLIFMWQFSKLVDLIPIPLIVVGNIVIIVGLQKSNHVDIIPNDVRQEREYLERKVTRLCLTISFTFLFLCAPGDMYFLLNIMEVIKPNSATHLLSMIFSSMSMLNSSVNFIIYAVMSKRYKQKYLELLTCNNGTSPSHE